MIKVWSIYSQRIPGEVKEKPFVSFHKPGSQDEAFFQIGKAHQINSAGCWRFFPVGENNKGIIFLLTDQSTYRPWPMEKLTISLVNAFLIDNKIFFCNN